MPKTYNNLFDEVASFDNLFRAFHRSRMGKRYIPQVSDFSLQREERLINLHNHLMHRSWRPSPPREFVVKEPKLRLIQAPNFEDRIVHQAIYDVINPLFERKFIHDSFACRIGKGHIAAAQRVQRHLRVAQRNWKDVWVLKADVSKFFASIHHDVLTREIARTIADKQLLSLMEMIIRACGSNGVGMPVGSLMSQLGANVLLNPIDHFFKDDMGMRFYVRYMDDSIIITETKEEAVNAMRVMDVLLREIGLSLNPKTAVHPASRGVDFCGYRIWATHMLPRKRNIKRARKQFRHLSSRFRRGEIDLTHVQPRVASFLAYTKHCQSARTVESALSELRLTRGS